MIKKQSIIQCFNRGAASYDSVSALQLRVAENLSQQLPAASAAVLEIGCGTGLFSHHLLRSFPHADFLMTDIAPAMVQYTKNKFNRNQMRVECVDGEALDREEKFDLIASSMTMHWFQDIKNSIQKIVNHLSPNGQFIFSMLGNQSLNQWRDICKKNNILYPGLALPSINFLNQLFPKIKLITEVIDVQYSSLGDFLMTLKKLGATASCAKNPAIPIKKMRQLYCESTQPIQISYEIIYGQYKNS